MPSPGKNPAGAHASYSPQLLNWKKRLNITEKKLWNRMSVAADLRAMIAI